MAAFFFAGFSMKIKKQLSSIVMILVILPMISSIVIPLYFHFTSEKANFTRKFNIAKENNFVAFSEKGWKTLDRHIDTVPPDAEILIIYRDIAVVSSIKGIATGDKFNSENYFETLKSTRTDYNYQVHYFNVVDGDIFISPNLGISTIVFNNTHENSGFIISRFEISNRHGFRVRRIRRNIIFYTTLFLIEFIFIFFLRHVLKIILNSVIRLKSATENIIAGDMETPIDTAISRSEADEISSLAENLEEMRLALKESKERRSRFIMGISHDLRTPVALIKGYSEAIQDGVISGDNVRNSVALINQNAERLEEMINELINYVKLRNIDWKHTLEKVELKPMFQTFLRNMECASEVFKRNISGTLDIPDGLKISLDQNLMHRVVENLFSNALRYTKENDSIQLNAWINDNGVPVFSIKDSGIGIPKKDQKKIFELFYRSSNSRRENGIGIGLAVVKTVVETHGWEIEVRSEPKKGTEFVITMCQ